MPRVTATASYRRRLSREDVETGPVLVDKRAWRLFPPPMQSGHLGRPSCRQAREIALMFRGCPSDAKEERWT